MLGDVCPTFEKEGKKDKVLEVSEDMRTEVGGENSLVEKGCVEVKMGFYGEDDILK